MDILIGKQGNQPFQLTESSISRRHAIFHLDEATKRMTLRDNNSTNGTWLLGNDGNFHRLNGTVAVSPSTLVRLGARYTFRIKDLLQKGNSGKKEEPPVDISKLRNVYNTYISNKMELESKQSGIMMWRIAAMSMGGAFGLILGMFLPPDLVDDKTASAIIKIIGIAIGVGVGWIIVSSKSRSLTLRKFQNEQYYKKNYCCPKCGYHFGTKIYDNLLAEGKCPNPSCRCKFKGS